MCGQPVAEAQSVHPTTAKMISTVTLESEPTTSQSDSSLVKELGKLSNLRRSEIRLCLFSLTLSIIIHIYVFAEGNFSHDNFSYCQCSIEPCRQQLDLKVLNSDQNPKHRHGSGKEQTGLLFPFTVTKRSRPVPL